MDEVRAVLGFSLACDRRPHENQSRMTARNGTTEAATWVTQVCLGCFVLGTAHCRIRLASYVRISCEEHCKSQQIPWPWAWVSCRLDGRFCLCQEGEEQTAFRNHSMSNSHKLACPQTNIRNTRVDVVHILWRRSLSMPLIPMKLHCYTVIVCISKGNTHPKVLRNSFQTITCRVTRNGIKSVLWLPTLPMCWNGTHNNCQCQEMIIEQNVCFWINISMTRRINFAHWAVLVMDAHTHTYSPRHCSISEINMYGCTWSFTHICVLTASQHTHLQKTSWTAPCTAIRTVTFRQLQHTQRALWTRQPFTMAAVGLEKLRKLSVRTQEWLHLTICFNE